MGYYQYHLFMCTNQRESGRQACNDAGAQELVGHMKKRIKELGLSDKGKIRINKAGCLNRCGEGPVIVIYPEETWYTFVDREDIDEIIDEHLINGRPVERLKI